MDFLSDWVSWSNFFYLIGLIVAGYATTVTAKTDDTFQNYRNSSSTSTEI